MKETISILLILVISLQISHAQCNCSLDLCSKQYNEVAYLTTHNAFNSDQDRLLFPNQTHNIASQLNDGVRGLMIDVYNDLFGTPVVYHSIIALGYIPLSDIFNDIKIFLDNNPNEVITIILECYVTANDIEDEINQAGLSNYLYTHNATWPTLQNMIDNDNRLVIFSDVDDASSSQDWCHYVWEYAVETHYSVGNINNFTCDFNRGDPLNDLCIFNHFVTNATLGYGLYNESNDVNANPFFINRALNCQTQTNKFPNFVTVDYYELGDGLTVVDQLNGVTSTSSINISEQNPERKL
ncbi:phosphatidylinositol-specific phospholipase C domain-containing protein [Flavobacteriales bacterium]|nr:phosphatidylinositol-specific phospholipase C domain-containing protein [Flavobacteriales bacterium]